MVSPQDCTLFHKEKISGTRLPTKSAKIVISEDTRIEKGGCLIESNSGLVDARLGANLTKYVDVENEWGSARLAIDNGIDVFSETRLINQRIKYVNNRTSRELHRPDLHSETMRISGKITEVIGLLIESTGLHQRLAMSVLLREVEQFLAGLRLWV
jgi:hypothetical protein